MREQREIPRLGELLVLASLWMLFGFMLWYYLSAFHVIPARWAAGNLLQAVLGDNLFNVIANPHRRYLIQVQTRIPFTFPDGSQDALGLVINPLVYGYGLPLLFGLVMATSQRFLRKLQVLFIGWLVISAVQVWGVFWEAMKSLAFSFGDAPEAAVAATGISDTAIALCYQLGVLILPALAPVIVWVLGNWSEVEAYTRRSWPARA
jgi:hypothetical protein